MAIFIGIHRMKGPVTEEALGKAWEAYKEAAGKKGLKALRVSLSAQDGIAICETEASSKEEVKAAHEAMENAMVPEEIFEVTISD